MRSVENNFFKQMRVVDNYLMGIRVAYELDATQKLQLKAFGCLADYVAEGLGSENPAIRFACENWRLSFAESYRLYVNRGLGDIQYSTFRSCGLTVSHQFEALFPFNLSLAFGDGVKEPDLEKLNYIITVCGVLYEKSLGNVKAKDILTAEVLACATYIQPRSFTLDECKTELKAIKTLSKSSVYAYLDDCDSEKLTYIVNCLNEPLLIKNKGDRVKSLNTVKLDILSAFGYMEGDAVSDLSSDEIEGNFTGMFGVSAENTDWSSSDSGGSSDESVSETEFDEMFVLGEGDATPETTPEVEQSLQKALYLGIRDKLIARINEDVFFSDKELLAQASKRCTEWYRLLVESEFEKALVGVPSDMLVKFVTQLDEKFL